MKSSYALFHSSVVVASSVGSVGIVYAGKENAISTLTSNSGYTTISEGVRLGNSLVLTVGARDRLGWIDGGWVGSMVGDEVGGWQSPHVKGQFILALGNLSQR
jgi:hypothetical protein